MEPGLKCSKWKDRYISDTMGQIQTVLIKIIYGPNKKSKFSMAKIQYSAQK